MRKIFNGLLQLHIVIMRILHLAHTYTQSVLLWKRAKSQEPNSNYLCYFVRALWFTHFVFIRCCLTIFYVHRSGIYEIFIQIYLNIMYIDLEINQSQLLVATFDQFIQSYFRNSSIDLFQLFGMVRPEYGQFESRVFYRLNNKFS